MFTATARSSDPEFYKLVHSLIEAQQAEQRGNQRRRYSCVQLVAPYVDGHRPSQATFRHVECRDLSDSGFSFYAAEATDCPHLVVALGPAPFVFVTAEVVRQTKSKVDGERKYLIGCRFTGRFEG